MSSQNMICVKCGYVGTVSTLTPGSIWIEIALWLCFLLPGLIYSLWRLNKRHDACAKCGSSEIIPIDSPVGRKIASETGHQQPLIHPQKRDLSRPVSLGRTIGKMVAKVIK